MQLVLVLKISYQVCGIKPPKKPPKQKICRKTKTLDNQIFQNTDLTKGCIRKSGTPDCTSQQSCSGHGTCEGEADQKGTCKCDEGFENDEELGCRTPPTPPPVTFAPNANTTDGKNISFLNLFMVFLIL